jgi:hypothetical protein
MQAWYDGMTPKQKLLVYAASVILIFAYGLGFIALFFLLYCEFGSKK